jgi:hypothetical protein
LILSISESLSIVAMLDAAWLLLTLAGRRRHIMDSSINLEIILILALITANGAFALAEMALVSARKARLRPRAEAGNAAAQTALELAEQPARFLSAAQVGITLVGILAAPSAARVAQPLAETGVGPEARPSARRLRWRWWY